MDIQNLLNNADFITALKWTGTILVTGFIAQFGRRFAEHLIDWSKQRRAAKKLQRDAQKEPAPVIDDSSVKEVKAPAEAELLKVETAPSQPQTASGVTEEAAKALKKADKAASKVEKKRLKAEKKNLK